MTPPPMNHPVFSALSDAESRAVMDRNHVGRLCFLNWGVVDVEPIHYVQNEGWIFLRSASGTKLEAFAHAPYVAFEVDEIEATFDWRSVVAHGTIYPLATNGAPIERRAFDRAVRELRKFIPETLTHEDPTPFRQTVYGIHIDALTGRMAEPGDRSSKRHPLGDVRKQPPTRRPDGF